MMMTTWPHFPSFLLSDTSSVKPVSRQTLHFTKNRHRHHPYDEDNEDFSQPLAQREFEIRKAITWKIKMRIIIATTTMMIMRIIITMSTIIIATMMMIIMRIIITMSKMMIMRIIVATGGQSCSAWSFFSFKCNFQQWCFLVVLYSTSM